MPILQVKNLRKEFKSCQEEKPDFVAVENIEFEVRKGEIFGLLGPNGAGKTTTISMLSCTSTPTSGTANIDGFDLRKDPKNVKKITGIVTQDIALYEPLSALDNLKFFGGLYGLRGKLLHERINEALDIAGLIGKERKKVENYSGGMKRRLNMAAGLLHRPKILYLDEPTVGVDPQSRNHIFESIKKIARNYKTAIIYTSHYMEEVQMLCDKVAIMDLGKIIVCNHIKNLIEGVKGRINLGLSEKHTEAKQKIQTLPNVEKVEKIDDKIIIVSKNQSKTLPKILNIIEYLNIEITSIEILEPNLESVFLKLTGKRLRDEQ